MATTNETAGKKPTAKAKSELAAPLGLSLAEIETRSITWVPMALTPQDAETLALVSKARGQKVFIAPARALAEWLDANREELEAEADERRLADERTEEEIAKEAAATQRKLDSLNAKLAARKP